MSFSFRASEAGFIHVCGHRGHSVAAPENTIAAFRAASDNGGTTCEIDSVLTRDKQIIVMHDLLVDRTTLGTGAVKDMTAAEVTALDAGSRFGTEFAHEPVPTLSDAIATAHELDLGLEVEIKEKRDLDGYIAALARVLVDPADRERVMMISFDHASLAAAKKAIPGLKTGGIVHERYGDPVAVAKSTDLDQLCIDLDVFNPADAAALHAAGISIRCHAYRPRAFADADRAGLDWRGLLTRSLKAGLIDTLSGDDVAWLRTFVDEALR
jgi:glycerophosphoryl diester phosphodiesterase